MSTSHLRKTPTERNLTRKMIIQKMDEMAVMMTAMEATIMEWEVWFRLITQIQKHNTPDQLVEYIKDGPIFTDLTGKIMESIRAQMPTLEQCVEDAEIKSILGADGQLASTDTNIIHPN